MDRIDRRLLTLLQTDASLTVGELAAQVGMSSTPVWKRIKRLEDAGVIRGRVALLEARAIGLRLTGFVLVRTSDHSAGWLQAFAEAVQAIDEIVEVHRMAGEVDYMLKVVAPDIEGYDRIYKRLIGSLKLSDVSASFSMEVVKATTALPLAYAD